jgi:leader peptidase (prepilin peptidase)/N-methyltransferase
MVTAALVGCWYCDVRVGIIPDYFTLVPLGALLIVALAVHDWTTIVSAVAVTVPFALAATLSRGRGMGWGDVKLVALGGAALGMQTAIFAFSAACLVAVVVAFMRKRRRDPIPFAPYLAGAMATALAFNAF